MTLPTGLSRRELLMKLGIFFNSIVALILAVPVVRYLLSPISRGRKDGYDAWVPLGNLDQFPSGRNAPGDVSKPSSEFLGW